MKTIAYLLPYFLNGTGKWPDYIDWYLASCRRNETIDFYIFTDDHSLEQWEKVQNLHFVYMTFQECVNLVQEKVGPVKITKPYKMCDMRPVYFKIFEEWVSGYDFWAFGDCDTILGDLRSVFTDEFLEKYDRFQVLGNLQIIRNIDEVNQHYLLERPEWSLHKDFTWEQVRNTEENLAFDEWEGVPLLVRENEKRIFWTRENFINIYQPRKCKKMMDNTVQENSFFQYWLWEDGKIFHVNSLTGKKKERLYIHLPERKMKVIPYEEEDRVCLTVNSEFKKEVRLKDTYGGWDFIRIYTKKIVTYLAWHIKHPRGKSKAEA